MRSFHPGFPGAIVPLIFVGTLKEYWRRFDVKDEALSIFLYFDSLTKGKLLFSLFEVEVMLLAIAINSQYSRL